MFWNSSFCRGGGGRGGILSRWRTRRRRRRTATNQTPSIVQEQPGQSWNHERQEDDNEKTDNNNNEEDDNDDTTSFLNDEIHKLKRETNAILNLVQRASQETPSSSLFSLIKKSVLCFIFQHILHLFPRTPIIVLHIYRYG